MTSEYLYRRRLVFHPFSSYPFPFFECLYPSFRFIFFFKWGNHPIRRQFLIFMCTTMRFQVGSSATLPLTLTPAPPYHYTLPLSNYLTTLC